MVLGHAYRKPSPGGVSDHVGALVAEIMDNGDHIGGSLVLTVEVGIGRLVAEPFTKRVDTGYAEPVAQRLDDPTLLPALGHKQSVQQDDKWTLSLDIVVGSLSAIANEGQQGASPNAAGRKWSFLEAAPRFKREPGEPRMTLRVASK